MALVKVTIKIQEYQKTRIKAMYDPEERLFSLYARKMIQAGLDKEPYKYKPKPFPGKDDNPKPDAKWLADQGIGLEDKA